MTTSDPAQRASWNEILGHGDYLSLDDQRALLRDVEGLDERIAAVVTLADKAAEAQQRVSPAEIKRVLSASIAEPDSAQSARTCGLWETGSGSEYLCTFPPHTDGPHSWVRPAL